MTFLAAWIAAWEPLNHSRTHFKDGKPSAGVAKIGARQHPGAVKKI
ncbi:Transposase [Cupriavidus necator]|nr:hypothetical protein [Cupriavidus necator]QQB76398.1 hypothetical protein I6H87_16850 [Cupriavidus necator]WKA42663.1 hypothetical protein QWP09_09270 [Cupriavidus necator]